MALRSALSKTCYLIGGGMGVCAVSLADTHNTASTFFYLVIGALAFIGMARWGLKFINFA